MNLFFTIINIALWVAIICGIFKLIKGRKHKS